MIIDSHVHMGKILNFNMPEKMILDSMIKYGVNFSLVSNIEGCEVDHLQKEIEISLQQGQLEINEKTIRFAKANSDKIGVLLWTRPANEEPDDAFEELIRKNRDVIYGIKVHPYHSKISFDSEAVQGYILLAEKYSLPIVTHTATDSDSEAFRVYQMALKYPKVNFVMYHMGLGSDNQQAIEYISKLPNLYGDTAWVKPEHVVDAVNKCGYEKILFGTDNPINGIDTYDDKIFYQFYWNEAKAILGQDAWEHIMFKNAKKLFNINI